MGQLGSIPFRLTVLTFFVLTVSIMFSQENQIMFRNFDIEKGLSNNSITAFLRDSKGFLWIGTNDGLNRYDGYSFKIYKHNPQDSTTLSSNAITYLAEDYNGNIWIGAGEYINILNPVTDELVRAKFLFNGKLEYLIESRWTLLCDKNGHYWFSSSKQGIYKYFVKQDSLVKAMDVPPGDYLINRHRISGITMNSQGDIWTIDYKGRLLKLHNQTLQVIDSMNIGSTLDNYYIIFTDNQDNIWVYDWNSITRGLKFVDTKLRLVEIFDTKSSLKLSSDIVKAVNQDDKGLIWIGTDHGGLNLLDKENNTIRYINNEPLNQRSLAEDAVIEIYRDHENIMWIGTYKKGVSYFHYQLFKFNHVKISLNGTNVTNANDIDNFTEDKEGNLWIGSNGGGLFFYNRKSGQYLNFSHDPNNKNSISANVIIGLTTDNKGNIWAGTYFGGLNKWDGHKFTHFKNDTTQPGTITDDRVWDICEDSEGMLWIATLLGGVNVFNPNTGKVTQVYRWLNDTTIRSNVIYTIIEDSEGLMWFATVDGVRSFNKKTRKFSYYNHDPVDTSSISSSLVFDLLEDSRGFIWAATANGISVINKKTKKIIRLIEKDGLPVNRIVTLLEDNNQTIWAGSTKGLSNIMVSDNDTLLKFKITNYDKLDGLQGNEFNEKAAYKTSNGELLFGGSNGFNLFDPNKVKTANLKPNLVFTDFQVYNESYSNKRKLNGRYLFKNDITYTDVVVLDYNENLFTIEFSNLNYFQPERSRYQYKMENFKNTWLETSAKERRITYTNLNPGKYTFCVRVANSDGSWNPEQAKLRIIILPPWWKTVWFRFVFIIGLIGLGTAFYFWRFKQLNQQKKILEEMVVERTRELTQVNTILEERQEEISIQNEELNYHREKLESQVALRTADLEKALTKAEDSDKLKSAFLANMSHEIRTPMNAIVGFSNLLRDLELTKNEQDEYIDIILKNCDSLLVIINDILDISKIEANQLTIVYKEFNLIRLFESLYNYYQLSKSENVQILHSLPTELNVLIIRHDEIRIRQVMQNMIDNAMKFTQSGFIKFGFNYHGNAIECFVQDTGKGIDEHQQHNIFQPFIKIEEGDTRFHSGAGLGLAICKRIANLMNGELYFKSVRGVGTTFTFKFPLTESQTENH